MSVEFKGQYGNFIGGEFVEPVSGQYMDNPGRGKRFLTRSELCEPSRQREDDRGE